MIGHLGPRVSQLLDGQLSAEETERAWAHVHTCHTCRDQVEREGWVKSQLATLSFDDDPAPAGLKGSLLGMPPGMPPGDAYLAMAATPASRGRHLGLAAIGGGAVGAAVLGVLALGAAPADAPGPERRGPVTQIQTPAGTPSRLPTRQPIP